jgi:hypothetical protein
VGAAAAVGAVLLLRPLLVAADSPDITGTWKCCGAGGAAAQTWVITSGTGTLSGHGSGGPYTFPISGTVSGNRATIITGPYDQLPGYTGTLTATISADGNTISGSWTSNIGQSGTFTATRTGAPAGTSAVAGPSTIATSLPTPAEAFANAGEVAVTGVVAIAGAIFLTFPAHLFNLTFEENYTTIAGWFAGPRRRGAAATRRLRSLWSRGEASGTSHASRTGTTGWLAFALVVAVGALLGGLLDPRFGGNATSAESYFAIVLATLTGLIASGLATAAYHRARHGRVAWHPRGLPLGLAVAGLCVLVSRVVGFEPGYLYGAVCGVAFERVLTVRESGHVAALSTSAVILVSVVAWLLLVPIRAPAAASGAFPLLVVADDFFGSVLVGGLVGSVIGLVPLRFLPGAHIRAWNPYLWAGLFAVALFALVDIVIRSPASAGAHHSAFIMTIVLFVIFASISVGFREYFAIRWRKQHAVAFHGLRAFLHELVTPRETVPSPEAVHVNEGPGTPAVP